MRQGKDGGGGLHETAAPSGMPGRIPRLRHSRAPAEKAADRKKSKLEWEV